MIQQIPPSRNGHEIRVVPYSTPNTTITTSTSDMSDRLQHFAPDARTGPEGLSTSVVPVTAVPTSTVKKRHEWRMSEAWLREWQNGLPDSYQASVESFMSALLVVCGDPMCTESDTNKFLTDPDELVNRFNCPEFFIAWSLRIFFKQTIKTEDDKFNRRRVAMLPPGTLQNRREFMKVFPHEGDNLKIEEAPRVAEEIYKKIQSCREILETTVKASRVECANESYTRAFFHTLVTCLPDVVFERSVSAKHVDDSFTDSKNVIELKGVGLSEQEIVEGLGQAIAYVIQLTAGPNLNRAVSINGYVGIVYTAARAHSQKGQCEYGIRLARYDARNTEDDISISWQMEPNCSFLVVKFDGAVEVDEPNEEFLSRLLFIRSEKKETFLLSADIDEQQIERSQDAEERNRKRRFKWIQHEESDEDE